MQKIISNYQDARSFNLVLKHKQWKNVQAQFFYDKRMEFYAMIEFDICFLQDTYVHT